jgi:hypothetical protein
VKLVEEVKAKIVADNLLRPTLCQVILLWYASVSQDNLGRSLRLIQ